MKPRVFTALALSLALGGCASYYGYVDDGGGYYAGEAQTVYGYGGYGYGGYGSYGYGSGYYGYSPGLSFGLSYGYPPYGYYGGPPYYYYPRPSHLPRPPRPGYVGPGPQRPGDVGPGPQRPPGPAGRPPPRLDHAPWRDLGRLQDGNPGYPPRRPGPEARADGAMPAGPRPPAPGNYAPPQPGTGMNPGAPPRMAPVRPARSETSAPRREQAPPRHHERPGRSATPSTNEP